MWTNDIVYGGEQLEPSVELETPYVLWDIGVVARNVVTNLGNDGIKAEVIISQMTGDTPSEPRKFGTFASRIVEKADQKGEGDLPAVIHFTKVESKQYESEAFVMQFVAPYVGPRPENMPALPHKVIDMAEQDGRAQEEVDSKARRERQRAAAKSDDVPI